MESPTGAHSDGHQHGNRKPTETLATEFCYQGVNLSLEELEGGGGGEWGEFGPLFLNFLDPPLTVSRSEPSIMLRNFYLAYLGYLTQLRLGGGKFDNVNQNLGGEFSTVWDRWV